MATGATDSATFPAPPDARATRLCDDIVNIYSARPTSQQVPPNELDRFRRHIFLPVLRRAAIRCSPSSLWPAPDTGTAVGESCGNPGGAATCSRRPPAAHCAIALASNAGATTSSCFGATGATGIQPATRDVSRTPRCRPGLPCSWRKGQNGARTHGAHTPAHMCVRRGVRSWHALGVVGRLIEWRF